jgi:four helix bundle protein
MGVDQEYPSVSPWAGYSLEEPRQRYQGKYDLEERTARFGESIIRFAKTVPENAVTRPLISQLVRAATSIGANTCEADEAISKKEFRQKLGHCRKESKETKHWLRMLATAAPEKAEDARRLWQEGKELHLIFCASMNTTEEQLRNERSH